MAKRAGLVDNLEIALRQLWRIGINDIFIAGSFVENVASPGDIDGYFVCDLKDYASGALERRLNDLEPRNLWDRVPGNKKTMFWVKYRIELMPYSYGTLFGTDRRGRPMELAATLRLKSYPRIPKGIVKIVREPEP